MTDTPDELREQIENILIPTKAKYMSRSFDETVDEIENLIKAELTSLLEGLPEKRKDAEYVSMYSYDYVQDGNLDDLCGYVADKSSDWGYNQALTDVTAIIQQRIKGEKK